jgi:hypothetical protein
MAFVVTLCTGMSINALTRYRGVKLLPHHKSAVMNDWDSPDEPQTKITEFITRQTYGLHWNDAFKTLRQEGLGVDHEEWLKAKEAARNK